MKDPRIQNLHDLPSVFEGPSAWSGKDMRENPSVWLYHLTGDDIRELENATERFLETGCDPGQMTKDAFPLPEFTRHLDKLRHKLIHGVGIELIRGLPVQDYSQTFAATLFCGIGTHLGSARSQNANGHILGHVRDTGASAKDKNSRIYQTSARQTFHTDSADVVGLLCIRKAREGGESLLVSAESIYNTMKKNHPELLLKLFDPVATDRRGEIPAGAKPFMEIPVFNWHENYLTVFYQRQYIDSAQQFDDAMRLTPEHIQALNIFDELANDQALCFSMQLEPGDMQFVYNHSQLHDRTAFVDWPESNKRRHLMRLWLALEGDRPLPECFTQRYGSIEIGNRGGIITSNTTLHVPVD